jgi:hypothetical protein
MKFSRKRAFIALLIVGVVMGVWVWVGVRERLTRERCLLEGAAALGEEMQEMTPAEQQAVSDDPLANGTFLEVYVACMLNHGYPAADLFPEEEVQN